MTGRIEQIITTLFFMASLMLALPAMADTIGPQKPVSATVKTNEFTHVAASVMGAHDAVKRQLEAIRGRNDRLAYSLNSDTVQKDFDRPQDFMRMLRQKKEPLYNYVSYKFLEALPGSPYTKISLTAPDGSDVVALFKMVQNKDGQWRTEKIILLQPDDNPI